MRKTYFVAVACAMALIGGTALGGGSNKVKTSLTFDSYQVIGGDEAFIVGNVRSKKARCKEDRRVTLSGRDAGSSERERLGADNSEEVAKAQFRIDLPVPDLIRMEMRRKNFGNGLICKASRSDEFETPNNNRAVGGNAGADDTAAARAKVNTRLKITGSHTNPDMEFPAEFDLNGKIKVAPVSRKTRRCARRRTVRVYRELPAGPPQFHGETKTNRFGKWFFAGSAQQSLANGTYFAKTPSTVRGPSNCSGDRSNDHVIDYDSF